MFIEVIHSLSCTCIRMSKPKLLKSIQQIKCDVEGKHKVATPVLLSDSKGYYLKDEVSTELESTIKFRCKRGRKTKDAIDWFKQSVDSELKRYPKIHLYVWLGTCDLTVKSHRFISLRSVSDETVNYLEQQFQKLINFTSKLKNVEVTFLEIPVYSITKWNESRRAKELSDFKEQDKILESQINRLNEKIRILNRQTTYRSPKFSLDLLRNRKTNKGKKSTYYYNFELYNDGIHPCKTLSKLWLKQLTALISRDCYM